MEFSVTHPLKLVFFEKFEQDERTPNGKNEKGETIWQPTGRKVQKTRYTLIDTETHEKIVLTSLDSSFEKFEGKNVEALINLKYNNFRGTVSVELAGLIPTQK